MALITGTLLAATKLIGGALSKKTKTPDAKKFVNVVRLLKGVEVVNLVQL